MHSIDEQADMIILRLVAWCTAELHEMGSIMDALMRDMRRLYPGQPGPPERLRPRVAPVIRACTEGHKLHDVVTAVGEVRANMIRHPLHYPDSEAVILIATALMLMAEVHWGIIAHTEEARDMLDSLYNGNIPVQKTRIPQRLWDAVGALWDPFNT